MFAQTVQHSPGYTNQIDYVHFQWNGILRFTFLKEHTQYDGSAKLGFGLNLMKIGRG